MDDMQAVAFEIIAQVGTAKSMYMEALQMAKRGDFDGAESTVKEADEIFGKAHGAHFALIQKESKGEELPFSILFMHAEDQMLSAETIKILVEELIQIYEQI